MKRITGCKNFYVDESGNVFDGNGVKRKTYVNGDGYITVAIRLNGAWTTTGVHRLVAMMYVPNDQPFIRTHVNHIDGNVTNNHYSNLDWVTVRENNIHHGLMINEGKHYRIIGRCDGREVGYTSFRDAVDKTGLTIADIWSSIKNSSSISGTSFRYRGSNDSLPQSLIRKNVGKRSDKEGQEYRRKVKTLNIKNGSVKVYESISACGKDLGIRGGHLSYFISHKNAIVKKLYQIAYEDEEFHQIPINILKAALEHGEKKVLAYNQETGEYLEFRSAATFIKEKRLSKKKVTSRLVKNTVGEVWPWLFIYDSTINKDMLIKRIKVPA